MSGWTRITVEDMDTGEKEVIEIKDDYVLIRTGECYLAHTNIYSTGTHILTIKNSKGQTRKVNPDG